MIKKVNKGQKICSFSLKKNLPKGKCVKMLTCEYLRIFYNYIEEKKKKYTKKQNIF